MSSQSPPSKKQRMSKPGEEWKETSPLEELEEKPRLPLVNADEVGPTLEVMEKTRELPSLPFANDYDLGPKYYIRECYDDYYELVMNMLGGNKKCVTVTGTPGIGKSIFYAYFFQRLQKEKKGKNTWIIAAAYKGGVLDTAFVYKESSDDGVEFFSVEEITDCIRMAQKEKQRVILLSDGSPTRTWGRRQMVVFTSPNDSWLKIVRKDNCTLYMPLWTLAELQEAAEELTLQRRDGSDITDEVIEKRFYTFGGVARECFYLSEDLVKKKRFELIKQIRKMSNLEDVRTLLCGNENAAVCYRILQFEAEHGEQTATSLASPFVVEELGKRMLELVKGKREEILQSLQSIPEGAALAGWTFEVGVHDTLGRGCKLQLRLLSSDVPTPGSPDTENLTIKEGETDEFTLQDLSAMTATKGPYHKPKSKQFESIDGFYIPKMEPGNDLEETQQWLIEWNKKPENRLILVQATTSESHPVNASGILNVLEKLGLKEEVKAHPERAALVFIVPEPKVASYKRQEIRPERHGGLTSVKHIGPGTVKDLRTLGITSVNQLQEAVAKKAIVVSSKVQDSLNNLRDESDSDAMTKIPQFVCCLPRSETAKLDKLEELGFMDRELNSEVLKQYGGDLPLVVKILSQDRGCDPESGSETGFLILRSVKKSHRKADH